MGDIQTRALVPRLEAGAKPMAEWHKPSTGLGSTWLSTLIGHVALGASASLCQSEIPGSKTEFGSEDQMGKRTSYSSRPLAGTS